MAEEVISISDSDEEAVPSTSTSTTKTTIKTLPPATNNKSSISQLLKTTPASMTPSQSLTSSDSTISSPLRNLDINTQSSLDSGVASGVALYQPLAADLQALRLAQATKKKRLPLSNAFPVVAEVFDKLRSSIGIPESKRNLLGLIQQYISSLKYYKLHGVGKCPNRCRVLARHVTRTMFLIRDLSRHFIESPHYSQKICELLALYIFFEVRYAVEFKDSKVKIAERIIHNIHVHLENAKSNFVLRIFAFLPNMGKENEIATKVFQRLIPEPIVMHKNEFPDRLFVQYLIAFYHWKEAWNDYEDQQKVVSFANKFMKPMNTIKKNKIYAKHLPCYTRREDATAYFLSNMVFFNDLKTASILDGIDDNGPILVDLSLEDKVTPPVVDLSTAVMEPLTPLLQVVKVEPREFNNGTVDLTAEEDDSWLKKLIRRAVALEVILPPRLVNRKDTPAQPVIELHDSDSENGIIETNNAISEENGNENGEDAWAFGPRTEEHLPQQQLQDEIAQTEQPQQNVEENDRPTAETAEPHSDDDDSNSLAEMFNELNSSLDFCDDSTTESEVGRKQVQKERYQYAAQLTNAQARITFEGVVEKELRGLSIQKRPSSPAITPSVDVPKAAASISAPLATSTPTPAENIVPSSERTAAEENTSVQITTAALFEEPSAPVTTMKETPAIKNTTKSLEACDKSATVLEERQEQQTSIAESTNREVEKSSNTKQKETPLEISNLFADQEVVQHPNLDQSSTNSETDNENRCPILQSPRDAITYTMDQMVSSFDSSDESDEDFLGRFQKPPFKTYLRKAHRRPKKTTTNSKNDIEHSPSEKRMLCTSDEENANHANLEKTPSSESENALSSTQPSNNDNPNVLFSGKVISLREDEVSGGVTPNYLQAPEPVDVAKSGSNVVFSMQGRRLSSFPSLKVTSNDHSMPDFDVHTGGEEDDDSNGRTDKKAPKKKKSNIAHNNKKQKSKHSDKKRAKAKSVWFAESTQVREIEPRKKSPQQKLKSSINALSSTINKISANKQHFTAKIFKSQSTLSSSSSATKSTTTKLTESIKNPKPNLLIQNRSNPKTTESSATTAALKSAQEKDLLQKLFPEAFAIPTKPERQHVAPKAPALIKAAIAPSPLNTKSSNTDTSRRVSMNFPESLQNNERPDHRRKSLSVSSCAEKSLPSDFDKYLVRKKLLKTSNPQTATQTKSKNSANPAKTEKPNKKTKKRQRKSTTKTMTLIADDPKLGSQMKPIVVLNRVEGPVFISLRAGLPSDKFTEICPGLFKLQQSPPVQEPPSIETQPAAPPSMMITAAKRIPAIRTKSLSDILSDAVVQEMTAAAAASIPIGKDNLTAQDKTPDPPVVVPALLADVSVEKQNQHDFSPMTAVAVAAAAASEVEATPLEEREKEEEDDKLEENTSQVPLENASVKSQDEMELKQIKKEDFEAKSSQSPETVAANSTKSVSDCFKKPLKSMKQKRSINLGLSKCVRGPNHTPPGFLNGRETGQSSVDLASSVQEPVTSTNSHLYPPLTSESESDSSCRTEQMGDVESSEQSDSSQSLNPLLSRTLKVKLKRHPEAQKKLIEQNLLSNSIINELNNSKAPEVSKKRRGRKPLNKKSDGVNRKLKKVDSTSSASTSSTSAAAAEAPASSIMNLDQRPPQSGLINGVLVPSIEAMNTPPPTPPTTVDDKSSVADDTSQEAKSQTATGASNNSNNNPSQPPQPPPDIEKTTESNVNAVSTISIPPNEIHNNCENLQPVQTTNLVHSTNLLPGHRKRFESVSLPSTNKRKRQRKKRKAEASDSDDYHSPAGDPFRCHLKKRRKTICTDVFNPPDFSSDQETGSSNDPAVALTSFNDLRINEFTWNSEPLNTLLTTATVDLLIADRQEEPISVRLDNEEVSESTLNNNNICDSSRLSPSNFVAIKSNASAAPAATDQSDKMEIECGSSCSNSNRPNCDSPVTAEPNLPVSRTYSKNNMVQQVFVPPEIEMFIEEPVALGVENKIAEYHQLQHPLPTASKIVSKSSSSSKSADVKQRKKQRSCKKNKSTRKRKTTSSDEEEEEDDYIRDRDYEEKKVRKVTKQIKKERKKGAGENRGKRRRQ